MSDPIEPKPNCRYIIRTARNDIQSGTVVEMTDRYVRIQWDGPGSLFAWYRYEEFFPSKQDPYKYSMQILEQIEPYKP